MSFSTPAPTAIVPSPVTAVEDTDPRRWRVLTLLACAELLGMSLWFAASAVSSQLGARWQLSSSAVGWITAIVQLGFVLGTAVSAFLNLADIVQARRLFALSAILGSVANATVLITPSYRGLLACRLLTGFALAGVYPPAMKMISSRRPAWLVTWSPIGA